MKETLKVHAFRVTLHEKSGNFEDLLNQIKDDPLQARVRTLGYSDIRIEDVREEDGLWFFDFGKFREQHGPGKASKTTPVRGFPFSKGEVFCEETACLYVQKTGHLIVQYNHHGARVGKIQEYLNEYDPNNSYTMELVPKYDDTVERKFHSRAATKKIVFEIDPRFLSQEDRVAGTALTQALDLGKRSRGEKVELTISAGRPRNNHLSDFIDKTANALKTKAGQKPDGVTKLKVGVLENLDSRMEVLDLIAQRLVHQFDDIPVGADLRFPQVERYKALKRAYNAWKNVLGK
ncbi:DUF6731 family protein [Alloalcanivorax profundimaris]|uniref:DUF6731 family protein n=1 Tax=Alloalcanivorax profundimaris TaxID=2735259 RepID=UPI001890E5F8|nr:DUF6731 family protein [Alloalcanivorax profundimaris]